MAEKLRLSAGEIGRILPRNACHMGGDFDDRVSASPFQDGTRQQFFLPHVHTDPIT
jgi:hypothetical protein